MATTVQIIGGSFQDVEGNPLADGYMLLSLSQDGQANSDALIASASEVKVPLDSNGNIVTSPAQYVWPNDAILPANTFYMVSAYTAEGQLVWGPNAQQVFSSPSPYNIGVWVPGTVNVSSGTTGTGVVLQTNGAMNGSQSKLNLVNGPNVNITQDGNGNVSINSTATGTVQSVAVATANGISGISSGGSNPILTLTLNQVSGSTVVENITAGISGTDINLGATSNPDPTSAGNILYWDLPYISDILHFGRPTNFPNSTGFYKNNSIAAFLVYDNALPVYSTSTGLSVQGLILNSSISTTATAGSATLPAAPLGFVEVYVGSTLVKIPYYAV